MNQENRKAGKEISDQDLLFSCVPNSSRPSLRSLRVIALGYAFVVILLGLSFFWNIHQAQERTIAVQHSYLTGIDDGQAILRARIVHRILELQIIEENRESAEHIAEEKL